MSARPDGSSSEAYKGVEKWSNRRWAWEFLRRNERFIQACEKVKDGTKDEQILVATEFGLKEFKMHDERYSKGNGKPKFADFAIRSWTNINNRKDLDKTRPTLKLDKGQVLILFDLSAMATRKNGLNRQLALTKERLNNRLAELKNTRQQENIPSGENGRSLPNGKNFLYHLRILDMLHHGKKESECAQILFPEQVKDLKVHQMSTSQLVKDLKKVAQKNAEEGYRDIAAYGGKPDWIKKGEKNSSD